MQRCLVIIILLMLMLLVDIISIFIHQDVVRVLLKKFRVADSPHKYALYERNLDDIRRDRYVDFR